MKNIATALVKAQKAFGPALKTSTNPHFKSRYADLAACVEAVMDALNDNGIFLLQKNYEHQSGIMVETVFVHESGEMLECGKIYFPSSKNDAQGFMSALTYCRRASLMAACGIAPEDDDGNASVRKGMSMGELADWLSAIHACDNAESLKDVFSKAFKAAQSDTASQKKIIEAKDKKKKEFE